MATLFKEDCNRVNETREPDVSIVMKDLTGGGAERVAITLANQLANSKLAVDLVLASESGPYRKLIDTAVNLVVMNCHSNPRYILPLKRYFGRTHPKAILACMEGPNVATAIGMRLSGRRKGLFLWEHSTPSVHYKQPRTLKERLMLKAAPWSYRQAEKVIAVSNGSAEDVAKFYGLNPSQVLTIPNPLDIDLIQSRAKEAPDHEWLARKTRPTILAVGRLTTQKDFETLIRAMAVVSKSSDAHLIILGEGELSDSLHELTASLGISDRVSMPGFLSNPYALMARCDLMVMSSRWEALPTVLIEALACGANVLSTDCPSGPSEILQGGKLGRLVPMGDPQALAGAILEELSRPEPRPTPDLRQYRTEVVASRFRELLLSSSYQGVALA